MNPSNQCTHLRIGVLSIQGAFIEHIQCLKSLSKQYEGKVCIEAIQVKTVEQLNDIDGLILPGGESTAFTIISNTLQKSLDSNDIPDTDVLKGIADIYLQKRKPIWGTCAGSILLAKDIQNMDCNRSSLGQMDMCISRNYFGRQLQSFEKEVKIHTPDGLINFPGVFIRAPAILSVGKGVEILSELETDTKGNNQKIIIAARQGNMLATVFHPELTNDLRIHKLFVDMVLKTKLSIEKH
jgi:5'-phosphate synthase pdxT subunit